MAIKLQIRKKTSNVWLHYKVDSTTNVLISDFTARWVGDIMEVTENSGVDNARFDISEIAVYDDTDSGTEETFVTSLAMAQRLKALGYTAFKNGANVVIADLISSDALNIIVEGTDGLLFAPPGAGTGTVTSVGLSVSDSLFVITNSPVTTSGTIALVASKANFLTFLNVEDGADVTDATNVDAAGATMNADTDLSGNGYFLDEDDMSSDDDTKVASQQSIKAYVDSSITDNLQDLQSVLDTGGYAEFNGGDVFYEIGEDGIEIAINSDDYVSTIEVYDTGIHLYCNDQNTGTNSKISVVNGFLITEHVVAFKTTTTSLNAPIADATIKEAAPDAGTYNRVLKVNGEVADTKGDITITESDVIGVADEDLTVTGATNIDVTEFSHREITLTGNATLTLTNLPSVGESRTVNMGIQSDTTETLAFSNTIKEYGSYVADGSYNLVTIEMSNTTTAGVIINVFYSQPN